MDDADVIEMEETEESRAVWRRKKFFLTSPWSWLKATQAVRIMQYFFMFIRLLSTKLRYWEKIRRVPAKK